MTDDTITHGTGGSPTSWRDVYQLVQDVERRLTQRMDDIAKAALAATQDHEARIRVLEATGSPTAQEAKALSTTNSIAIEALRTIVQGFQNRERFVGGALSATQKFILLLAAIIGGVVGLTDLIRMVSG